MRVLLTGASGFVGSHVLRHLLTQTDWEIVCPVTFHHRGLPVRIASAVCDVPPWQERVTVVHWDMRSHADAHTRQKIRGDAGDVDVIMNVASESHVDRSIENPVPFVETNVSLMLRILELARTLQPKLFLQMSTDEVYGPAAPGEDHTEWSTILPSNPYSASKAAQEAIAFSYWRTYGVPLVITNTMNIIGEMQDAEKFVPMIIRKLHRGESVPVHVDSRTRQPGSRMYLHARNLADAWLWLARRYTDGVYPAELTSEAGTSTLLLPRGVPLYGEHTARPDRFNIVGESEINNVEMVHLIGFMMGLDHYTVNDLIEPVDFHATRPGHDRRYALDGSKIRDLGWSAPVPLMKSLERTVQWTLDHPDWLEL